MAALAVEVNDVALVALRGGGVTPAARQPGARAARRGAAAAWARRPRTRPASSRASCTTPTGTASTPRPPALPFPEDVRRADLAHAQLGADPGGGGSRDQRGVPGRARLLERGRARPPAERGARGRPPRGRPRGRGGGRGLARTCRARRCSTWTSRATARWRPRSPRGTTSRARACLTAEGAGLGGSSRTRGRAAIAGQFVRETRFDPRHAGVSEQALHDALPGWLGELCLRQALPVALQAGGPRAHDRADARLAAWPPPPSSTSGLAEQVSG